MPERRYYTVTQEQEVKVWANTLIEAAQIGDLAFKDRIREGDLAATHVLSPIRERALDVVED